jgi:tryptophan-rich sensory protein
MIRSIVACVVSVLIPQIVGALAGFATMSSVNDWYPTLEKPWFTPPDWLFAPAWITLYTLMGIASFLVWRQGWAHGEVRWALGLYAVQLALNAAWSPAFFGAQSPGLGLLVIVPLLIAVVATTRQFWSVSTTAGAMMVPYVAWVAYATALNSSVWWLN